MNIPDPSATSTRLAPLMADDLVGYCMRVTGPCRVRLLGTALGALVAPLRAAGCDVLRAIDAAGATLVIAWAVTEGQRVFALNQHAVVLVLVAPDDASTDMDIWTNQAAAHGWQRHPAVFALEGAPAGTVILVLSRDGVQLANADVLQRASYHGLAARLVRPGDAVLATDASEHGLWRIVQQQSRCRWLGVVTDPSRLPPQEQGVQWLDPGGWQRHAWSVDVVIAQLSHVGADLAQELQHKHAALVRSGRLVLALPYGAVRNALDMLMLVIEQQGMVVDRIWRQSLARPLGLDQFLEVPRDAGGRLVIDPDCIAMADALVLMAVKLDGPGVEQNPSLQKPNIIAFQRDYLDASVVRLIVAMGLRLESVTLRRQLARKVMDESPASSADYGAALCVLLYDSGALEGRARDTLLAAAQHYIDAQAGNPTVLRWQVSLAFAAAVLHQAGGNLVQAAELYERVLDFDVLAFSPLLGTKTIAAAVRLGWIRFGRGDLGAARQAWSRGLDEAHRLSVQSVWSEVVGDPEAPETFAMPELAAMMDEAGCLASALRLTAEEPLRPGMVWQLGNLSWRSQLHALINDRSRLQMHQVNLQQGKDWLESQYHNLTAEVERLSQELTNDRSRLQMHQVNLQQGKDWLESQYHNLTAEVERLSLVNASLQEGIAGVKEALGLARARAKSEETKFAQQLEATRLDQEKAMACVAAARHLYQSVAPLVEDGTRQNLEGEAIVRELTRLATKFDRLAFRRFVQLLLRTVMFVFGRRSN